MTTKYKDIAKRVDQLETRMIDIIKTYDKNFAELERVVRALAVVQTREDNKNNLIIVPGR